MPVDIKYIDALTEKLKLSGEEIIRELKTEIYKIKTKYGVSSIEEFEDKYRTGEIEEENSWQEFQRLDHLEYKIEELEKSLSEIQ